MYALGTVHWYTNGIYIQNMRMFCVVFAPHLYVFSCCQVLLADEQSTVRAVKRQQFKMFDDQYKFGDDLSQYVLCTYVASISL